MATFNFLNESKIEKRQYQLDDAAEIVRAGGKGENVGLVYPTGTGKTLTAFIAADHYLAKGKVLFLAHTNPLCQQHCRDARELFNLPADEVNLIVGRVSAKKRGVLWDKSRFIVATPQTIVSELEKGGFDFTGVCFVIFDEMHMANKKYDYVDIAKICQRENIRTLGLTASSGNGARIKILEANFGLRRWIYRSLEDEEVRRFVFPKCETPAVIDYNEKMLEALQRLRKSILRVHNELAETELFEKISEPADLTRRMPFLRLTELNDLFPQLKRWVQDKKYSPDENCFSPYRYVVLYGAYYKLMHLLNLFITEGYEQAERYVKELEGQAASKDGVSSKERHEKSVARRIVENWFFILFRRGLTALVARSGEHPKQVRLFGLIEEHLARGDKILLFSNYEETLEFLKRDCLARGWRAEVIAGNQFMKVKEQQAVIARFAAGEFPILLATTVVEAGIHVPKIDVVINYSMPLTGIAQIQRGGRAGRTAVGIIYYLIMDNSNDSSLYFAARATNKTMDRELERKQAIQTALDNGEDPLLLRGVQRSLPFAVGELQRERRIGARQNLGRSRRSGQRRKRVEPELF